MEDTMSNESENTNPGEEKPAVEAQAPVVDGAQTGQEAAPAQDSNPSPEKAGGPPETVPYHVFQERNFKLRQAEEELARLRQSAPQQQPQHDPNREPKPEDFPDDYQAYLDARTDWRVEMGVQRRMQQQQGYSRVQNAMSGLQRKVIEEATKNPALHDLASELNIFTGTNPALAVEIAELPDSTAILKFLRENPAEKMRLQYMAPGQQYMEVGALRIRLAGSKEAPRKPSKDAPNLDLARPGNKPGTGDAYSKDTSVDDYISATRPIPTR
jgi:hypothetical protein